MPSNFLDFSAAEISNDSSHSDLDLFGGVSNISFNMSSFGSSELNAPCANVQTVSPKDVFAESQSAPPSSAMTNLSTPQTYTFDSPGIVHSTDTSPMFYDDDELDQDTENWGSLFPTDNMTDVQSSIELSSPTMQRTRSSPGSHERHPSVVGLKPRRKEKPLPPINIDDENDPVVKKRKKNTEAARKSRQKKVQRFDAMQEEIDELKHVTEQYKDEVNHLKTLLADHGIEHY